jgi:uncharacterized protein (DUF362 family)
MTQYGAVCIEPAVNADRFMALIQSLNLTPPVLIKPNWGTVDCFSEADILDWTLSAISGQKLVIESHGWARNEETLLHKEPASLTKANLRRGDHWFLEHTGIAPVLAKHQVEYLNLTEEVWAGRTADPDLIRAAVEAQFAPVQFEEHYARVPSRVYDLRGGSLLSLSKYKLVFYPLGVSLSIKNLFGLIPGPSRGKYHGKEHAFLDQNIVDINKIYRSLFTVKGVIESIHGVGLLEIENQPTAVRPGCGLVLASEDLLTLDATATAIAGRAPDSIGHLRLAAQTFGHWDSTAVKDASLSEFKVL